MTKLCVVCTHPLDELWDTDVAPCLWDGDHPNCVDCGRPIVLQRWNRRCFDCHERSLAPMEEWSQDWTEDD